MNVTKFEYRKTRQSRYYWNAKKSVRKLKGVEKKTKTIIVSFCVKGETYIFCLTLTGNLHQFW